MKRVGILVGREKTFPEAIIRGINERGKGVVIAEYIKLYLNGASAQALARISNDQLRVKHLEYDKGLNEQ